MNVGERSREANRATGVGVTRRTVAKGSAWAAPVLLSAMPVPAFASSEPCAGGEAAPLTNGDKPSVLTFVGSLVTATVGFVATDADGTVVTPLPGGGDAAYETGEVVGGAIAMVFDEPDDQIDLTLTMTIALSQPVTGMQLTVADIDKDTGLWEDWVVVGPAGFTVSGQGSYVVGDGTDPFSGMPDSEGPFRSRHDGNIPDTDTRGHVTVQWPLPVQQVQVQYLPGDPDGESSNGQHIRIGGIGFTGC